MRRKKEKAKDWVKYLKHPTLHAENCFRFETTLHQIEHVLLEHTPKSKDYASCERNYSYSSRFSRCGGTTAQMQVASCPGTASMPLCATWSNFFFLYIFFFFFLFFNFIK